MPHRGFDRFTIAFVAILGLSDVMRSAAPLFLWPDPAETLGASIRFAGGVFLLALAGCLWRGRGIRAILVLCVPTVAVGHALRYRAIMDGYGVDPFSTKALPMWALLLAVTGVMLAVARWMWRTAPRRAPNVRCI